MNEHPLFHGGVIGKHGISYIFLTTSSIFHLHGGLINLKTNPRENTKCSRFARKVMYSNFEKEKKQQRR
jgi:hypothetical protein